MSDLSQLSDADLMAALRTAPDVGQMVTAEAQRQGVDPGLALSVARTESGLNPNARSPKGALGVMQLMPGTAQGMGVDPNDLQDNIRGGVGYLKQQVDRFGDPKLAAAAYNAGPGAVERAGGVPDYPETQNYVEKVAGGAAAANMSDADLMAALGMAPPAAAPAAETPPQAAPSQTPVVINPQTGKPYNDAQEATYAGLIKSGKLDPNATPGSQAFPRGLVDAADRPTPGEWYVDTSGKLQQAPGLAEDVGKGFLGGVERAGAGIQDALMSANPLAQVQQALTTGANLLSGHPEVARPFGLFGANAQAHTYQPKTTPGAYAASVGEMIPNAVTPGGVLRKAASVVLPAIGSQFAGDAAQASGASPLVTEGARFLGGLLGGGAAGLGVAKAPAAEKAMTLDELKQAKNDAYAAVDASGFKVPSAAVKSLADDMGQQIRDLGGPKAARLFPNSDVMQARLAALAKQKGGVPLSQLDKLRSDLYSVLVKPGGPDSVVGAATRGKIDALLDSLDAPAIQQARDLNARVSKVQAITDKLDSADLRAGSTYSGGNYTNAVRQNLRSLVDPTSSQRIRNLSPAEDAALRQVVQGTPGQNATRYISKLLTNKIVQAPVAVITHGIGAAPMEAVGTVLNKLGQKQTEGAVQRAIDTISRGGRKPAPPFSLTFNPGPLAPINAGSLMQLLQRTALPAAPGLLAGGPSPQPASAQAPRQ